jgi:hypothetical protein
VDELDQVEARIEESEERVGFLRHEIDQMALEKNKTRNRLMWIWLVVISIILAGISHYWTALIPAVVPLVKLWLESVLMPRKHDEVAEIGD